jgi:hypothetical protein
MVIKKTRRKKLENCLNWQRLDCQSRRQRSFSNAVDRRFWKTLECAWILEKSIKPITSPIKISKPTPPKKKKNKNQTQSHLNELKPYPQQTSSLSSTLNSKIPRFDFLMFYAIFLSLFILLLHKQKRNYWCYCWSGPKLDRRQGEIGGDSLDLISF